MSCAVATNPDEPAGINLLETEKYLAVKLIDEQDYTKVHKALSSRWDRLHSLSAAMKLMEKYGVVLTPEEEARLATFDESQQINALVMKMPQQSNEQFQQFFLQLQLLVSTATRVRLALESGRPDQVEEALTDAETTGIAAYILRMALVQAGSEVLAQREQYHQFMKEVDARCGKLIRGQEDAMTAQKRLASAHAQLALYQSGQSSKAKSVIMNFAAQSERGLFASVFKAWCQYTKQTRLEAEIVGTLKQELEISERRLVEVRQKQLNMSRGLMMRKGLAHETQLQVEIFKTWRDEVTETRERIASAEEIKALESKLQSMESNQKNNAQKVMMRMNASSDYNLFSMVFQGWVTFHIAYGKDREMEDRVKASEQSLNKYMSTRSDGAKKILSKMGGATDSGLVGQVYAAWKEVWDERKKEAELEAHLNSEQNKAAMFADRNKDSGMSALDRARHYLEQGLLLKIFGSWKLDSRMERTLKIYHAKIDAKRGQLLGVQHMFRRFATELEGNLKASADSTREFYKGPPPGRKLHKTEGTVSLPDINQKQSSGRNQVPATPGGRVRTPVGSTYPSSRSPLDNSGAPQPRNAWH